MLKKLRLYLYNHLGFSKAESNGLIVLIFITLLVAILPRLYFHYFLEPIPNPQVQSNFSNWVVKRATSQTEKGFDQWAKNPAKPVKISKNRSPESFPFDPNAVTVSQLESLGFTSYVAERIAKYRQAGGTFNVKEDMLRIYGIDSSRVLELYPFMTIDSGAQPALSEESEKANPAQYEVPKKTDINQASSEILQEVYGVGPGFADRIVKFRNALGGFHSLDQLSEVYHLPDSTISRIKERFEIGNTSPVQMLDINLLSEDSLRRHPYIDYKTARLIANYRQQHGPFASIEELKKIKPVTDSLYQKLYPYLSVNRTQLK
jgi:DNA uptake protein ComE-like DNA-binding protein